MCFTKINKQIKRNTWDPRERGIQCRKVKGNVKVTVSQ